MLKIIDSILWSIATILMVYSGIYFTYKLKFVQFNFKEMFKNIIKKKEGFGFCKIFFLAKNYAYLIFQSTIAIFFSIFLEVTSSILDNTETMKS